MATAQKKDLVVSRIFDASVQQLWQSWIDPQLVMQWWGPTGFTCPVAKMDVREGGQSLLCMRTPKAFGGQDMYNTWTYTKISPQQRMEFVFHFSNENGQRIDPAALGLPSGMPDEVRHVVTFEDLGSDTSKLTVTEQGYESDQIIDLSKAGLEQCLDKMAAIFASALKS